MRVFVALFLACVSFSHAFQPLRSAISIRSADTRVNENFGFNFAEDPYENTPDVILGEVNLKDGKKQLFSPFISLPHHDLGHFSFFFHPYPTCRFREVV